MDAIEVAAGRQARATRGKIVLATVKGDVHDIGKNIVGIVLGCNGYEVIDLGVMVPCETILERARDAGVDIVGLSGLITPSLDEMAHVAAEMQRLGMRIPLLIGGATTSAKHTAVKIAPKYDGPTVHVRDASRSTGVVERLLNVELQGRFLEENRREQQQLVDSFQQHTKQLVPYPQAVQRRFRIDWETTTVDEPSFLGRRALGPFPLAELVPYIDWSPFFHAWDLKGKFPLILQDPELGPTARDLYDNARRLLDEIVAGQLLTARAVYGFWPAASVGDDIAVFDSAGPPTELARFHTLRQQWERRGQSSFLALADFVAPHDAKCRDYVGGFAVTAGVGTEELVARCERDADDYRAILARALADRLAEAFAELLHERARRDWGYGQQENLTKEALLDERYRGIRPAPGYPCQPDHTEKRILFDLLDAERQAGVKLTESFAMHPAASICGLYFGHEQAKYFAVGPLGRDQVADYAARKGMTTLETEKWLRPNLGYE